MSRARELIDSHAIPDATRPRMTMIPMDQVCMQWFDKLKRMDLRDLTSPDTSLLDNFSDEDDDELDSKFLDLQLLRVITHDNSSESGTARYVRRNQKNGQISDVKYTRMFLCRIISESGPDSMKVVYIIQGRESNQKLFDRHANQKENGALTIGTIFRVWNIMPVENMIGDINCLNILGNAIIMKTPSRLVDCPINPGIKNDTTWAFTLNDAKIRCRRFTAVASSCGGNFRDKQRIQESKYCGCYNFAKRKPNMAMVLDLVFKTCDMTFFHQNFVSQKFSLLFLTSTFHHDIKTDRINASEYTEEIKKAIKAVLKLVNEDGGWTIIGWYRRGLVQDKAMINHVELSEKIKNSDGRVEGDGKTEGDVTYHVTSIIPSKREYLDPDTEEGKRLKDTKFDTDKVVITV